MTKLEILKNKRSILSLASKWKISARKRVEKMLHKCGLHHYLRKALHDLPFLSFKLLATIVICQDLIHAFLWGNFVLWKCHSRIYLLTFSRSMKQSVKNICCCSNIDQKAREGGLTQIQTFPSSDKESEHLDNSCKKY